MIARLIEILLPERLGVSFRWLWSAAVVENAGDGIALAAGPLLIASQTRDPFLVSLGVLSQYLAVLIFGLIGGAVADRLDRRRLVLYVNLLRAVVVIVLVVLIVTNTVNIPLILITLFVMGTAETFADSASSTLIPSLVERSDLVIANSRMQGAFLLTNQLVAPPIGAFLFAAGMALPFAVNAVAFVLSALLISRVVTSARAEVGERPHIVSEMAEGIRWLVGHPPMRTLALTIFLFNVTYGAAWSVLVLYAGDRLGLNAVGFGLMTTAVGVGGIAGVLSYGRLARRFALGDILRVGLLIETGTHLVLALTTSAIVALGTLVIFGAHAFVWGATGTVVRQRAVPDELMGRVGGVYRVAIVGGIVIGAPIGGVIASHFGVTAPFWFAFIGSAILVVLLWREFNHIAHDGDPRDDDA